MKVCDKTCIFFFFPIINKYFLMAKRSLLSRCPSYIERISKVRSSENRVGVPRAETCHSVNIIVNKYQLCLTSLPVPYMRVAVMSGIYAVNLQVYCVFTFILDHKQEKLKYTLQLKRYNF